MMIIMLMESLMMKVMIGVLSMSYDDNYSYDSDGLDDDNDDDGGYCDVDNDGEVVIILIDDSK
jgi:hypothetical protein